jgi:hypothetical protein
MKRLLFGLLVLLPSLASTAVWAQSPLAVKYCRNLAATYRKAVADGKTPVPEAGQAAVNCPTNPPDSIATLEAALNQMKVELPPKE